MPERSFRCNFIILSPQVLSSLITQIHNSPERKVVVERFNIRCVAFEVVLHGILEFFVAALIIDTHVTQINLISACTEHSPVSYTHLDVYKRQYQLRCKESGNKRTSEQL